MRLNITAYTGGSVRESVVALSNVLLIENLLRMIHGGQVTRECVGENLRKSKNLLKENRNRSHPKNESEKKLVDWLIVATVILPIIFPKNEK